MINIFHILPEQPTSLKVAGGKVKIYSRQPPEGKRIWITTEDRKQYKLILECPFAFDGGILPTDLFDMRETIDFKLHMSNVDQKIMDYIVENTYPSLLRISLNEMVEILFKL